MVSTAVRWRHPMVSFPHWHTKILLFCPLGGVLTPGPYTHISLCSLLFCWEGTSQSCVWDPSSPLGFLAGFLVHNLLYNLCFLEMEAWLPVFDVCCCVKCSSLDNGWLWWSILRILGNQLGKFTIYLTFWTNFHFPLTILKAVLMNASLIIQEMI